MGSSIISPTRDETLYLYHRAYVQFTCAIIEAGFMQDAREELQTNDRINEYHKEDEECNVEEGDHRHDNTVEHNL